MTAILFSLKVQDVASDVLKVVGFEGTETLSRPYRFDIDIVSTDGALPVEDFIGKPATLTLDRSGEQRKIHGVVSEIVEGGEAAGDYYAYRLSIVPRVSLLSLSRHNRSFGTQTAMSVMDVVVAVLTDTQGLALAEQDYSVQVQKPGDYPARDFWAQYDETDFDFIHRLLEHWGIFYYFEQDDTHEKIVFLDVTSLAPEQALDKVLPFDSKHRHLRGEKGVVQSLNRRLRAVTKSVQLKDYNDQTPQIILTAEARVPGGASGLHSEYAANFRTEGEGKLFAKARAEELGSARDVFELSSTSPFVVPGFTFSMAGHFRKPLDQGYFPVTVRHTGIQAIAGAFFAEKTPDQPGYHNMITAIPAKSPYRSPRQIKRPVMAGVMPAMVDAMEDKGERAVLDPQGRYKVTMNFDTSDNPLYQKSAFIRMAQPYGGPNTGMHFPLLKGTEVIIGWVDGDPDRPLILGAVPNPQTVSPVTKANQTENKIQTSSGMALIMNDGTGTASTGAPPPAGGGTGAGTGTGTATGGTAKKSATNGTGNGVYSAFTVPSATGTPPDYLRIGDIAANDPEEALIINDPAFMAGTLEYRAATLTSDQYAGIFSYTGRHRTTTTGGNETTAIAGHHRLMIGGDSVTTVSGRQVTYSYSSTAKTGSSGSSSPPVYKSTDLSTDTYSLSVTTLPKFQFVDSIAMNYNSGLTYAYTIGLDMKTNLNVLGTYAYRLGASLSLSGSPGGGISQQGKLKTYTSSYSMGTSGSLTKGMGGLDSSTSIYATQGKNLILGNRTLLAAPVVAATIATAAASAVASGVAGSAMQLAENILAYTNTLGNDAQSKYLTGFSQGAVATTTAASYAASLLNATAYFYGGGQDLLNLNKFMEPTIKIAPTLITISNGTSKIEISPTGIKLSAATITLESGGGAGKFEMGPTGAMSANFTSASVTAPSYELTASASYQLKAPASCDMTCHASLTGSLTLTGDLAATGTIESLQEVSAPIGRFGP